MTYPSDPCRSSNKPSTSLEALASLLRHATELGRRRTEPCAPAERPTSGGVPAAARERREHVAEERRSRDAAANELSALVRKAVDSYDGLERRAQEVLGPERSFVAAIPALLELGGLAEALQSVDTTQLRALSSATFEISKTLMSATAPPGYAQLRGRRKDGRIEVYEPYWNGSMVEWLLRLPAEGAPDTWQVLEYLPKGAAVIVRLTWYGLDRVGVSSGGTAWSSTNLEESTGTRVGYVFDSPELMPVLGQVDVTMTIAVDRGRPTEVVASYDVRVSTPEDTAGSEDDDGPVLVPTPIPDPVPDPGPNWRPTDLLATGVDPRDTRVLGESLVALVLELERGVRAFPSSGARAFQRDAQLLGRVSTVLRRALV